MSDTVKAARFTPEWAERIDKLGRLVQFPEGTTSVLRKGVEAMWKRYGAYADVLAENTERISEEARLARLDLSITKIGDTEIETDAGEVTMYADLIIENAEGRWYGVHLGGDDWDYLSDNGDYVPVPVEPTRQTVDEFIAGKAEVTNE